MTKPLPVVAIVEAARRAERRAFRKLVRGVGMRWMYNDEVTSAKWGAACALQEVIKCLARAGRKARKR